MTSKALLNIYFLLQCSVTYRKLELRVKTRPKAKLAAIELIQASLLKRLRIQDTFEWQRNISHRLVQFMLHKTNIM